MTITIAKQFTFDAAHQLHDMPEGHKCRRMHGHTYGVEIRLQGQPGPDGLLIDYAEIAEVWSPIFETLDHRYLNEIEGLDKPTTEVLVQWIYEKIDHRIAVNRMASLSPNPSPWKGLYLHSVKVSESSSTWAEYHGLRAGTVPRQALDALDALIKLGGGE